MSDRIKLKTGSESKTITAVAVIIYVVSDVISRALEPEVKWELSLALGKFDQLLTVIYQVRQDDVMAQLHI